MCEKQGQKQFGFRTLFWCFLVLAHFLQPASAFWSTFGARVRAFPGRYIVLPGVDANADFVAPDELGALLGGLLSSRAARLGDDLLLQFVQEQGDTGYHYDLHFGVAFGIPISECGSK